MGRHDGKPIYFDSIDNSAYILGQAKHSARKSWNYIDGESFMGARVDVGGNPNDPTSTSLGNTLDGQGHLAWYGGEPWRDRRGLRPHHGPRSRSTNMTFNGAVAARLPTASPGESAGQDNGWVWPSSSQPSWIQQLHTWTIRASSGFPGERRTTRGQISRSRTTPSPCWI